MMFRESNSSELQNHLAQLEDKIKGLQDSLSEQRAANTSSFPSFKPIRPDTFRGCQDKTLVEAWLFQLHQYFEICSVSERSQVPFAASLLRDNAALWWRCHVEQADNNHEELITTWKDFKKALIDQFKPVNAVKTARDKLANLKQAKSVQEYVNKFRSLILEIPGITEDEKIDRFIRGLKEKIRMEVELREPTTLNETIRISDRYDTITFKYHKQQPESIRKSQETPVYLVPASIELDNYKFTKLTDQERDRLLKTGACFFCRKPGHMAYSCPMKKAKKSMQKTSTKEFKKPKNSTNSKKVKKSKEEASDVSTVESNNGLDVHDEHYDSDLLVIKGYVGKISARILIDGGASRSFISDSYVKKNKLKTSKKIHGIVDMADGSQQTCKLVAFNVPIRIKNYIGKNTLSVSKIGSYDIILGKP